MSFQPGLRDSNDLRVGRKVATFFQSGRAKDFSARPYMQQIWLSFYNDRFEAFNTKRNFAQDKTRISTTNENATRNWHLYNILHGRFL